MTAFSILVVGLLLGMQHATDADHLAAVATLAARQSSLTQSLRQGLAWGVGHTLTLMAFAGAIFLLGQAISPNLELALETAVGVMLIVLGADVLHRLLRNRIHFHVHRHDQATAHLHAHSHRGERRTHASSHRHAHPGRWPVRALVVGMMHGLAGSAALVMLSLKDMPSLGLGLGYIAVFGLGSIAGMAALSVVIALPLRWSSRYLDGLHRTMTGLVGLFSCALGGWIVLANPFVRSQIFG